MIRINLDAMMAKRKMSLGELSERVGITLANLSILKNNHAKAVRFSTLDAICKALDCQPSDILEYVADQEDPERSIPPPNAKSERRKKMNYTPNESAPEQQPVQAPPEPQRPKLPFADHDTPFAYLSILLGFCIAHTFPVARNTLGTVLLLVALLIFGGAYVILSGRRLTASTLALGALILLFSIGFLTGANRTLQGFLFFFIVLMFLYWVYTAFSLNGGRLLGENCFLYAIRSIFVIPFNSVIYIFPAFAIKNKKSAGGKLMKTLLWILIGLGCAIIPTAIIIALLSYDAQFTALMKQIFRITPDTLFDYIMDLQFGFIFAVFLFGVFFGSKRRSLLCEGSAEEVKPISIRVVPRALICATVTPILAVYVIFFISQWDYYLSAFTKTLPETLTYAEYAREGFFQLCWVSAINAVLLLLFHLLIRPNGKKRDPLRAIYSVLISLFTLVLIATALSKMLLYIDSFGLTRKRVYASWLIVLLAVFFIIALLGQLIKRLPVMRTMAVTFVIFFALIALPNVDSMIASYNVDAYLSGKLQTVDVESIAEYGVSSVPALVDLKRELEAKEAPTEAEQKLLQKTNGELWSAKLSLDRSPKDIFSFNIPKEKAKSALAGCELANPFEASETE